MGRRKVLIPAVVGFSLICGLTGAASGMGMLLVFRATMGLFEGAYTPASIAHTSESSTPSRRGFNMGLQQSLFALLGLGVGPIIATQLLDVLSSWRWVFSLVALPRVCRRLSAVPNPAGARSRRCGEPSPGRHPDRGSSRRCPPALAIFAERNVLLATAMLFGNFSCVFVMVTLMPSYLTDYLGLSATHMGFVLSAFGFGGFVGYIALPALSDRLGRKPVLVVAFVIGIGALIVFRAIGANLAALFLVLFVAAVCEFGALCLLTGPVVTEAVPAALVASAAGLPIGIGEIAGGGLTPVIGEFIAQHFGINSIIFVAIVGLAISLTMSLFLRVKRRQSEQRAAWARSRSTSPQHGDHRRDDVTPRPVRLSRTGLRLRGTRTRPLNATVCWPSTSQPVDRSSCTRSRRAPSPDRPA
ncbi:MFS transporter [Streptomyces sp. NBC_00829]|uniref:MFS transporter n=1 Tax=Streptomyces sp. NBC_00829 TaxID=2903679 RepID=UPI0038707C7E